MLSLLRELTPSKPSHSPLDTKGHQTLRKDPQRTKKEAPMKAVDKQFWGAFKRNDLEATRMAVDAGADINSKDEYGYTALSAATLAASFANGQGGEGLSYQQEQMLSLLTKLDQESKSKSKKGCCLM
mmetsp:Transcript_24368/g.28677  ORF Transcript_24368/g.28677 Transcript_24368/m.28677 type:complete len:127 (+) Transcript_24368:136-516(+)